MATTSRTTRRGRAGRFERAGPPGWTPAATGETPSAPSVERARGPGNARERARGARGRGGDGRARREVRLFARAHAYFLRSAPLRRMMSAELTMAASAGDARPPPRCASARPGSEGGVPPRARRWCTPAPSEKMGFVQQRAEKIGPLPLRTSDARTRVAVARVKTREPAAACFSGPVTKETVAPRPSGASPLHRSLVGGLGRGPPRCPPRPMRVR